MKLLFVCTGNAARSQFGQAIYNTLTQSNDSESAGTEVIEGKPIPEFVMTVLSEHNIIHNDLRLKQITKAMYDAAERVVLFTDKSLPEYLIDSPKVEAFSVEDPRGKDLMAHQDAYAKIEEIVRAELGEVEVS